MISQCQAKVLVSVSDVLLLKWGVLSWEGAGQETKDTRCYIRPGGGAVSISLFSLKRQSDFETKTSTEGRKNYTVLL